MVSIHGMPRRSAVNPLVLLFVLVSACSTDSCSCNGFESRSYPTDAIDVTVPSVGQARVTPAGLTYVSAQVPYILERALPGGLSFCIPRDTSGNPDLCVDSTCTSGANGCQVDLTLADQAITPRPPDTLEVEVTIGSVDERLNFDYDTFLGNVNCYVQLFKKGASESTAAFVKGRAPIRLFVDQASPFKEVGIELGDVTVDLEDVDFKIKSRGGFGDDVACGGASLVRGLFRDRIEREIQGALADALEGIRRDQLCRACDAGMCPTGSTCAADDFCEYGPEDCVPRTLGVEGRLDIAAATGDFLREDAARIDVVAKGADTAIVDDGVTVGLRSGFKEVSQSDCAPVEKGMRPAVPNLSVSPTLMSDMKPGGGSFQFGVGLHKSAIEHALWTIWASGGTCLEVSDRDVMVLSTTAFTLVAPSMEDFAGKGKSAVLSIVANEPPTIELGANTVTPQGDTYVVDDPLLRILWNDVDFHVFGYARDRMVRLFTLRIDLDLPVALVPDGNGNLVPIVTDLEEAIANIEPRRLELLEESADKIRDIVPTLLGFAGPQIAGAIPESIAVPELLGFRLDLNQGDIRGVDNNEYLAIFANLARVNQPQGYVADTAILSSEIDYGQILESGLVRPTLRLDVASWNAGQFGPQDREVEFSYRVDGGFWSMYRRSTRLLVDDPLLAIQGDHTIEVRARVVGEPGTADPRPARLDFVIDWNEPEVEARRAGDTVFFDGFDLADQDLEYRLVDNAGNATTWTERKSWKPQGEPVFAEARDDSGRTTRVAIDGAPPAAGGCSTGGGPAGLLGLLLFGAAAFVRRRRGFLAAAALLAFSGCNGGCKGELATNATEQCFGEGCNVEQVCTLDSDCAGICPEGNGGICEDEECVCVQACEPGCAEGEFCCLSSQMCQEVGNPCEGDDAECGPGYEVGVQSATPNRETCELDDVVCDCVPLPPIPVGWHGEYTSIDSDGTLTVVATYNDTYGDLMVGSVGAAGEIAWQFVDGVPTDGELTGDPNGYRGGRSERGPKVGTHTAVVVSGTRAHVFYRDEDAKALKWGVAEFDGTTAKFSSAVIDSDGDPGQWTAATLAGDQVHVLYGADGASDGSELRHVVVDAAASPGPATPTVVLSAPEPMESTKGYPLVVASFIDLSAAGGTPFAVFHDGIEDRVGRMQFTAGSWSEPTFIARGTGPHAAGALGADGAEHAFFMMSRGVRYSRFGDTATGLVDDGKRLFDDEYWYGTTGEGAQLRVDGSTLTVAYQDAFDRTLITATSSNGTDWTPQKHPLPDTGTGFWTAMTSRGTRFVADMVIDRSREHGGFVRVTPLD